MDVNKMLMKPKKAPLPLGENIVYELKYDGGSSRVKVEGGKVEIFHGAKDVPQTHKYPEVIDDLKKQKDGLYIAEIVVIDAEHPGGCFNKYQKRMCEDFFKIRKRAKLYPTTFIIHDILETDSPFIERRKVLKKKITPTSRVKVIDAYSSPKPIMELQEKYGTVEGTVAKDINSKYEMNSRNGWWKERFNVEETVKVVDWEEWIKKDGNEGIVMITDDNKRINLSGPRQYKAKEKILDNGFVMVEISYHKASDKGFRFTTVKRIEE